MASKITQNQEYEGHEEHFLEEWKEKKTKVFKLL